MNVATAGVTEGLFQSLQLPAKPEGFVAHLKDNAVRSFTAAAFSVPLLGEKPGDAFLQAAAGTVIGAAAGVAKNNLSAICVSRSDNAQISS